MSPRTRAGLVSVVVLNYQGAADTIACLGAFDGIDWPGDRLELIVVDNASGDDSVERIRRAFPHVTIVESEVNTGFAGGCNLGADAATGQYLAFVNNDARPDPGFIREAVAVLDRDLSIGCVASKVLDWEGNTIDFVDAALSFYGHAFKLHVGDADSSLHDAEADVLFASGAGLVMRTDVFRSVGGFDERYFLFFEDVDLGWRLWLLGHRVRYVPSSLVFHRHHATMKRFGQWREHFLLERNALFTIYKNYDDQTLARVLPAALALAVRRGVVLGGDDPGALDLQKGLAGEGEERLEVSKQTLAPVYAIDAFVQALPGLTETRRALQAARQRTDQEILRLFRTPMQPNVGDEGFLTGYRAVVDALGVGEAFSGRRRILVATGDTLTPRMAGPAIRAWQIACALSSEHDVELVTPGTCEVSHPRFRARSVTAGELRELERWCDVIVFQGFLMHEYPFLRTSSKVVVVDIYDPFHLEQLEQGRDHGEEFRRDVVHSSTTVLNEQLLRGDFFMCASTKQRDFWLGQLAALGRVNARTYDEDETLESLITVVPFGVSDVAARHTRPAIKGVIPGIGPDDKVILWGGGIYNWFDPLTLIRAVARLRERRPDARLFFLGLKHPNPNVPEMRMAVAARSLADELGVTGTHVFFNEDWVAYEDRQNYLLEADIGVSTHLDHVETAFSFRTRILDYLWAALPIVATRGDALADLIETERLGIAVPPGDVEALEDALFRLLDDEEMAALCRKNVARVAPQFAWARVLAPLVEFCRAPRRAPDLLDPEAAALMRRELGVRRRTRSWRHDLHVGLFYLRAGGPRVVVEKALGRIRRQLAS
ncbi:MAG TPA: glycosyltransferase [Acidimicrobiales bacterium]|nr:glycosyltransferase [Acidimicrobiales bacterium]